MLITFTAHRSTDPVLVDPEQITAVVPSGHTPSVAVIQIGVDSALGHATRLVVNETLPEVAAAIREALT